MQDNMERISPPVSRPNDDDIDLWALAQTLWKRRLLIAAVTGVGTIGAAVITFSQPNIYTASATIMPVDSSSDRLSSALMSLGALGGLASQADLGLKGSVSDKFIAILRSRSLAEQVINQHNLMPSLFHDRWDEVRSEWKKDDSLFSRFISAEKSTVPTMHQAYRKMKTIVLTKADPKTGMVEIRVDHPNPKAAADIANSYVIELNSYLKGNSFTSSKQNRVFLEEQLSTVTKDLGVSETALRRFQEENKLVSLDAQSQASVETYAELKSLLMAKEMEISLHEKSTSENDVQLIALRQEAAELRGKLTSLETGTSGGFVSFKDAPRLGMRFAQLTRELLVRQKVFELITQQYELAKIEEAKEALTFQVIDKAIPPDQKSKPRRLVSIVVVTIMASVIGGGVALVVDRYSRRRKNPEKHLA